MFVSRPPPNGRAKQGIGKHPRKQSANNIPEHYLQPQQPLGWRADDRCFMPTTATREKSVTTTRSTIFGFILAALAACLAYGPAAASPIVGTYTANSLGRTDDSTAGPVALGFTMNFFGHSWSSVYVNNNGNVTFGSANSTYTPTGLNGVLASAIIAPFYADVDTRPSKSGIVTYAAVASGVGESIP